MFRRQFLSLVVIGAIAATASTFAQSASVDSKPSLFKRQRFRSSDLGGLRLRGIGPATMSGRFVDMDVVESNPYVDVCRVRDGRHVSHHRQRDHVGAGVRA